MAKSRLRSRGSVVTTAAMMLPSMFGFVSMGVDWGRVSVARFAVRAAADEAALVAASALTSAPTATDAIAAAEAIGTARATQYATAISLDNLTLTVQSVSYGYYDKTAGWSSTIPTGKAPNAAHAIVTTDVPLTFARLFGIDSVTVTKGSKAGAAVVAGRAPDLVVVQDVTPSMSSGDIANSKLANTALIDCIEGNAHPSTRGAFLKFANIDKTVVALQSYQDAPGALRSAVTGASPSTGYSNSGICVGGGCTSHSAGLYGAISLLNATTEPPEGVGQAVIVVTDGAPYTNDSGCTSVASSSASATPYQKWMVGTATARCGALAAATTSTACNNVGGRWFTSGTKCRPSDNGAEGTGAQGPGKCTKTSYTSEARCEGNGGTWTRSSSSTANPSSQTAWTDQAKALAEAGTWGPIDVYAVYYSSGASATYKADNLSFLANHVVRGKGAELGVLDAPTGSSLVDALEDVCKEYTVGSPGLIE
ncbi:MAG: vWA domain-containing protein [Myxococcota bacterium]